MAPENAVQGLSSLYSSDYIFSCHFYIFMAIQKRVFEAFSLSEVPKVVLYRRAFNVARSDYFMPLDCSLEAVSSRLEKFENIQIFDGKIGISVFFKNCKHHPKNVFIKKGETYELNLNVLTPANLKAIGYMLSMAYACGVYVDMKFSKEFLNTFFRSITKFANDLLERHHASIYSEFRDKCDRDKNIRYNFGTAN